MPQSFLPTQNNNSKAGCKLHPAFFFTIYRLAHPYSPRRNASNLYIRYPSFQSHRTQYIPTKKLIHSHRPQQTCNPYSRLLLCVVHLILHSAPIPKRNFHNLSSLRFRICPHCNSGNPSIYFVRRFLCKKNSAPQHICHFPQSANIPCHQGMYNWGLALSPLQGDRASFGQPALVFLPGESHGQRSLAGYSL